MSERIVVDPITRIEGHLRIEAQMDGDRIAQAYSCLLYTSDAADDLLQV